MLQRDRSGPRGGNAPTRHHFLPEFYLSQWCGPSGQLTRYMLRGDGHISTRATFPAGVGYRHHLYTLPGGHENPWIAQQLETHFFAPIDDAAAKAMDVLLGNRPWAWTDEARSAWSRFILSVLHRTPHRMELVLRALRTAFDETTAELITEGMAGNDPIRAIAFAEWSKGRGSIDVDRSAFAMLSKLIDNDRLGQEINALTWLVIDTSASQKRLLSSDYPVMLVPLHHPDGHIAMPISPTKIFFGTFHQEIAGRAIAAPADMLVRIMNQRVVERADALVIAIDDTERQFVEDRLGTARLPTLTGEPVESRVPED